MQLKYFISSIRDSQDTSKSQNPKSTEAKTRGMGHGARASAVNGHTKTRNTKPPTHDNYDAPHQQPKAPSPLQRGLGGG